MAFRNISVTVTANISQYTRGLRAAEAATRKFNQAASSSSGGGSVATTANVNAKAMHNFSRGMGSAATQLGHYSAGVRRGNKAMEAMAGSTGALGKGLTFVKTMAASSVAAFGGFITIHALVQGITQGIRFLKDSVLDLDTALTESMSIMDDTGPKVKQRLQDAAQGLAMTTTFSAAEIGEGFYHLVAAGYDLNETLKLTPIVAAYAQAGLMDMEAATEQLAQTQAALGMLVPDDIEQNAINMQRIADGIAVAANKSTASVEDFGDALTNKSGTALSLANQEFETGINLLMAYARVGIKGKVAGTQLAIAIRDIQKAGIQSTQAMSDLGIEVFDANNNMNDMEVIVQQMGKAFNGMSDKGLRMTLKQLGFADRSVHAILPLIATSNDVFREQADALDAAGGAAQRMADKQLVSLANQYGIVVKGAQEVAVAIGQKALAGGFAMWERFREPINHTVKSLQKFAKEIALPALAPTVKLLGGAFLGVLQAIAQVMKGIASISDMGGDWTATFASVAVAALAIHKILVPIATAAQVAAVRLGVVSATNVSGAAAAKLNAAATAQQAAATEALAVASQHAAASLAAQRTASLAAAGASKFGVVDATGTAAGKALIDTANKGAAAGTAGAAGMTAFSKSITALKASIIAALPYLAALAAAALVVVAAMKVSEFRGMGEKFGEHLNEQTNANSDFSNIEEQAKSYAKQRAAAQYVMDEADKRTTRRKGLNRLNPVLATEERELKDAANKMIAETNRQGAARELYYDRVERMAKKHGISMEAVEKKIASAGVGQALFEAGPKTKEAKEILDQLNGSMEGVGNRAKQAGVDVEYLAAAEGDAGAEAEIAQEKLEALGQAVGGGMDPSKILSDLAQVNEAIANAFGANPASVFSDLKTAAEEAADKAADAAMQSSHDAVDAQTKALKKQRDDLEKDKVKYPKKASDAMKAQIDAQNDAMSDGIDAQKEAIDEQIEALNDGKKAKEDFAKAPQQINMSQFMTGLQQQAAEASQFTTNLMTLRNRLQGIGLPQSQVDDIVTKFAEMGAEAAPLINEFATASEERFIEMARVVSEQFKALNPEIKTTLGDFIAASKEEGEKARQAMDAMISIQGSLGSAVSPDALATFFSIEGTGAMAAEMAALAASGAQGAATVTQTINDAIKAKMLADGTLGETLIEQFKWAQVVADAEKNGTSVAAAVQKAIKDGYLVGADELIQIQRDAGIAEADARIQGYKDRMALEYMASQARTADGTRYGSVDSAYNNGSKSNAFGQDANKPWWMNANGNIMEFFSKGGLKENHKAQIAPAGAMRVWAEPETGGEAYIPLSAAKRGRSVDILSEVARRFGYGLTQYANGGMDAPGNRMIGGGHYGSPNVQVIAVPVPIQSKSETNFNGDIRGIDFNDAQRKAKRMERRSRLTK